VRGHEYRLGPDAVRAAGVHPEHGPVAPVVQDRDLLPRDHDGDPVGGARDQGVAHEVGGVGDARAVVPGAGDHVPPVGRLGGAHGRRPVRAAKIARRTEDGPLAVLGEVGADDQGVVRAQGQAPAGARVTLRDSEHDLPERRQAELVAAEPARLQDPVEAGRGELAVQFGGVVAEAFGLVLLAADGRDQRPGPADDRLRRQVGLGDRDFLGSHVRVP